MTEGILIRVVITIAEVNDLFAYQRQFCAYYRVLEDDFCATEKYLTVNPDNYSAYSTEFLKQIQAICSEIDVSLQFLCKLIKPGFNKDKFPYYCKCILTYNPLFPRANVSYIRVQNMMLTPWFGWKYIDPPANKPKAVLTSDNPEWWTVHNKIKHDRIALREGTGKPYYKYANQGNVLNALAALFIVDSYTLHLLCEGAPKDSAEHFLKDWYESSKMFAGFLIGSPPKISRAQ